MRPDLAIASSCQVQVPSLMGEASSASKWPRPGFGHFIKVKDRERETPSHHTAPS